MRVFVLSRLAHKNAALSENPLHGIGELMNYDVQTVDDKTINIIEEGMLLASFERNNEHGLLIDIDSEWCSEVDLNELFKRVNELI